MNRRIVFGGCRIDVPPERRGTVPLPIRMRTNVPDVSWMRKVHIGDDQGTTGSCVLQTFRKWSWVMHADLKDAKYQRTDAGTVHLYQDACKDLGRGDEGLTVEEGYHYANWAGWLPFSSGIREVHNLDAIVDQPLLGSYVVNKAIDNVSANGCMDHTANSVAERGYHEMLIAAHGHVNVDSDGIDRVLIANHWTAAFGWNGFAMCDESLHRKVCIQMHVVK